MTCPLRRPAVLLLCALGMLACARAALASSFTVNPTQIQLSAKTTSALLTLKNESDDALRFQITAFAWAQDANGEMQLAPTDDVVFFPALLTLPSKQERKIRVGTTKSFGATEKTYRIFVEELPPLERGPQAQTGVRVLTKMGVPVFLQAAKPESRAALEQLSLAQGIFSFALHNVGNTHFVPDQVRVTAADRQGNQLFEQSLNAWYVLAGDLRKYEVTVPAADCGKIGSFAVDVRVGPTPLQQMLQAPNGACRP